MGSVITLKVSKGGVGKTTISSNLAYLMSTKYYKVLMIDLDSQANLSKSFIKELDEQKLTSSNLLGDDELSLENSVYSISENLDLITADIGLGEVAKYLESTQKYYNRLKQVISNLNLKQIYDFIFIDLPPGVADSITQIALVSSDLVVCPAHFDIDSLSGIIYTLEDISRLHESKIIDQELKYLVVPNRYDRRFEKDNKLIFDMIYDNLEDEFISNPIRENSHIKKARMRAMSVIEYENLPEQKYEHKRGIEDFEKLSNKILDLLN